ncbi:MAG TPA: hypothetical protein VLG38_00350, partial [Gammaproteobacteria bacterium]|nr:hypothetical protein [Gammaproteobacteria bacterium]
ALRYMEFGMDAIPIQQGVLNTSPEVLHSAVKQNLQFYLQKINALEQQNQDQQLTKTITDAYDFLNALAEISPTCKQKLATTANNVANLKHLLADLTHSDEAMLQLELTHMLQLAHDQTKAQQLKMSQQLKAALAEQANAADKIVAARSDKAPFDYLSSVGLLVELMMRKKYIVPKDEEHYALGFDFHGSDKNEYEQHLRNQHGGDKVFPNAPVLKQ